MFRDREEFLRELEESARASLGRTFAECGRREKYLALVNLIAERARERQAESEARAAQQKKVYYFSMEFMIGRLLRNYLMNFGVLELVEGALREAGVELSELCLEERDPGLGNGGLGRLAACFLDSLASLGYAGHGMGIRYRYGLFRQRIEEGRQIALPDDWLESGYPWEVRRPEEAVLVRFGGEVIRRYENGALSCDWEGGEQVVAMPYDIPIVGYGGGTVNNLRIWGAEPCEERFDMDAFNRGDYAGAVKYRADVEAITSILYPEDSADPGKVLRLKQEYLFVAAGVATIVRAFKAEHGTDFSRFADCVAIHTNDTHPALCAPELMRVLIDEEGLGWDEAWEIARGAVSYTNHTILPEAMESWPIDLFRSLLPRVYDFVEEIDRRYRESFPKERANWQELLKSTAILWDGRVRMANLSVIAGHAVNGVAALHTEILKKRVLGGFYQLAPEKFQNKTNGVSHRRFLAEANPSYAALITEAIGDGWLADAGELVKLEAFVKDSAFLERAARSKRENKERLARYVRERTGLTLDPGSIFDVQVKRFHAYKRQLLNIFKVMDLYNRITGDSGFAPEPVTFLFAGKAAQGYAFAKDVIRLIHSVAQVINGDPRARGKLAVAFLPDFSVSSAQLIYPAAELSEQISTAGMEASGTGNMKFMMNGALTLGTLDGSTVEIAERLEEGDIALFGLRVEEIEALRRAGNYLAWDEYHGDARLARVVDQLTDGTYAALSGDFPLLHDALLRSNDEFFVLRDFRSYLEAWERLVRLYGDRAAFWERSVRNTARSGFFSSDRTIREYAGEIWHL